jgi:hypothetical protein
MQLYVKIGDILTDLHDHIISLRVTLFIFHQNLSFSTKEKSITSKTSLTVLITDIKVIAGNLNAARYRDEIIAPIVLPFLRRHRFSHVFQHDNARSHVARESMDFLNDNHIRTLPWPALSPDLKLIKHLWDELGRRVRKPTHH